VSREALGRAAELASVGNILGIEDDDMLPRTSGRA
jgi:hypothetical protein